MVQSIISWLHLNVWRNFCGNLVAFTNRISLLLFYENSKRLDTAYQRYLCHLSYAFSCHWHRFCVASLYLEQIQRTCNGIRARYQLHRRVAMIVHGLSAAIFFRGIFALAKSKRSRINRSGYFSCFFHYFGSYAHTSNISGILSTRLVALALLSFFSAFLHRYKSRFSLFPLPFAHFAALLALFRKLCGFR